MKRAFSVVYHLFRSIRPTVTGVMSLTNLKERLAKPIRRFYLRSRISV